MTPFKTSVPVPFWMTAPVPAITEAKSVPWAIVLERLKASVALFVIALSIESDPVEPPLPIWSFPELILVVHF